MIPYFFLSLLLFFSSISLAFTSYYDIFEEVEELYGEIHMVGGTFSLKGGGQGTLRADFHSSNQEWLPQLDYQVKESVSYLSIKQPVTLRGLSLSSPTNHWELILGDRVPLHLDVILGAAKGELDLKNTSLKSLKLTTGVGDVDVDLSYTPFLHTLHLRMGVGNLNLNLAGPRTLDLQVFITGGVGRASLYLPQQIGVQITMKGGIGRIRAQDFMVYDSVYRNRAYGETHSSIYLQIRTGVGEIFIKELPLEGATL